MSQPTTEPNPATHLVLGKLANAATDIESRPEAYTDETLRSYLRAAMRLARVVGAEYTRRTAR